jgi:hypothetical protein
MEGFEGDFGSLFIEDFCEGVGDDLFEGPWEIKGVSEGRKEGVMGGGEGSDIPFSGGYGGEG